MGFGFNVYLDSCEFNGVDGGYAKDYCWVHGSYYIPVEYQVTIFGSPHNLTSYQMHMKCIVDIDEMPDAPHPDKPARAVTGYYQWVTFVMAIQAAIFYLPHKVRIQLFWHQFFFHQIWLFAEGGLLESFGSEAKQKVPRAGELLSTFFTAFPDFAAQKDRV